MLSGNRCSISQRIHFQTWQKWALINFLADGILKEIPIVKTLHAVAKVGYNVKERNLLK